ncbi:DUF418 domain-containing protein [Luteimonas pelagia]
MSTSTRLAPVAPGERIEALDVLRGFALLGILLMNIEAFVGPVFGTYGGLDPALTGWDRVADALAYVLVQGKFYPLFSLLFGMGFAVMLARARGAGRPFAGPYLRRTLSLLAIGLAHALLVWSGDILVTYALVALVLPVFADTPVRRLPRWGVVVALLPAAAALAGGLAGTAAQGDPAAAADLARELAALQRSMDDAVAAQHAAQGGTDYWAAVTRRVEDVRLVLGYLPVTGASVLGMFLLGTWFVRSGAIARPGDFAGLYARLRWIAFPAGLGLMLLSFGLVPTVRADRLDAVSAMAAALAGVAGLLMCLGYLAWVLRGLESSGGAGRVLRLLAPAGRMALTHYLLQSVLCTWLFSGHGLGGFEALPRGWQIPFAAALFALQVAASHWWLARFRFGPMEWLWRSVTYARVQPMRRARAA